MSRLSRYNLLISEVRHGLQCQHNLGQTEKDKRLNQIITQRSLEAWIFLTDDLMCENNLLEQSRNTRITNLIKILNDYHIALTLDILKRCYDLLLDHISGKNIISSYGCFKDSLGDCEATFIGALLSPIKESLHSVITSQTLVSRGVFKNDSKRDMWICAHYFQFLNKLNYSGVGLEDKALSDYLLAEAETASLDIEKCEPYIKATSSILAKWLKDWDYDGSKPRHGSGSVADTKHSKLFKYYRLASDTKINYLYKEENPSVFPFWRSQHFDRVSKLVFVPKNITKLRSISMEPATLQYLQQGCMNSLYRYFDSNKDLHKILKLSDQFQNQSFAYHGSITNDYATIDLSHASDSVNWIIVKKLFSRTPKLLKWLICTRSTHTLLPTGETIRLSKFAPMGSALCFPIESLIFAAIAKLSINLSIESGADRNNVSGVRNFNKRFTVYGDDIIIPSYAANTCVKLLKLFGFTPNEEKSYLDGPFKESCGGNYFCGCDITPLKFSPQFDDTYPLGVSPAAYSALCSYANLAYTRGLRSFRLYCIKLIFESGQLPLFTDNVQESPAIYSDQPTNFHLKMKYSKRYQKYQYIYTGIKAVEDKIPVQQSTDEDIFLFDKLLSLASFDNDNYLSHLNAKYICKPQKRLNANKTGKLVFDIKSAYNRATLNEQIVKYTLCFSDV